jgi:NAD(P)H-dependent FMN reductase
MYTIISATNRKDSNTLKVAKSYQQLFKDQNIDTAILSLEELTSLTRDEKFNTIETNVLAPTEKFIFIMPEYNGSFPGIFKLMIDISDLKKCWNNKKVMLVGVSSGRAGNLRGIDNMTNMCNYMKMHVFYSKLPLSSIHTELNDEGFVNESTINSIKQQISDYILY